MDILYEIFEEVDAVHGLLARSKPSGTQGAVVRGVWDLNPSPRIEDLYQRMLAQRGLVDLIDRRATDELYKPMTVVVFHARPHLLVPGITPVELTHIFCTQFIDFHLIFA